MEFRVIEADTIAEVVLQFVANLNAPLSDRFAVGTSLLVQVAEVVAKNNNEFSQTVALALGKTSPLSAEGQLVIAMEYLKFVQTCAEKGLCACGRPECGNSHDQRSESDGRLH